MRATKNEAKLTEIFVHQLMLKPELKKLIPLHGCCSSLLISGNAARIFFWIQKRIEIWANEKQIAYRNSGQIHL